MKPYVIAAALQQAIEKKLGKDIPNLQSVTVSPEDAPEMLDWLQEYMPGEVEIELGSENDHVWLWYINDGYVKGSNYARRFVTLEQWLATPPPTPEHPAKQPNPNEID